MVVEAPTSSSLLHLCNLSSSSSSSSSSSPCITKEEERQSRLSTLKRWCEEHPTLTNELLTQSHHRDTKTGCMPLHWLAGTGFDEAIAYLLSTTSNEGDDNNNAVIVLSVDQPAQHPSTERTPLHYAARNGHLSTCQLLIERYGANPHPKCGRGGVTPLQLAVWQNRLDVVKYLIQRNGIHVIHERNDFNCGLNHWIGLIPRKRWCSSGSGSKGDDDQNSDEQQQLHDDDDGSGVLPLARYLHSLGISYESTPDNSNTQGHTCNHKAAWGGNLPLLKYFRNEHEVYDTIQDAAGNYCADIAKMRGNMDCHQWLLEHGSGDRVESYKVLGLEVGVGLDIVRKRYMELAKMNHPDKAAQYYNDMDDDDDDEKKEDVIVDDFIKIKQAYEHLTKQNGMGTQKNPKYDELKLLEYQKEMKDADTGGGGGGDDNDDDDLFVARLIAVISDYGEKGFPVGLFSRRWNQIWPDRPFPTEYIIERSVKCNAKNGGSGDDDNGESGKMLIQKRVKLVKWLKWKCRGTKVKFHQTGGEVLAVIDNKTII